MTRPWIIVDVESDGPFPPRSSMICFGAILLDEKLETTFYGQTAPISTIYEPETLAISGFTRKEHEKFLDPEKTMLAFKAWLPKNPVFISDNPAYDFPWINYYMHTYTGSNPFGWSGRRIGDLYCGLMKDTHAQWKHLRQTRHTHNPVDDAKGNAEALLFMIKNLNLKKKL